jgi:hypothetical protein
MTKRAQKVWEAFCGELIRQEGEEIHNGFNFYPLTDKGSFGFIFRYGPKIPLTDLGSKIFRFRYSKITKKWIIKHITL